MGTCYKGDSKYYRSIGQNILLAASKYPYNPTSGRFGTNSPSTGSWTRNIASADPAATAKDFYDKIAFGGIEKSYDGGKRKITQMADGTIITWRMASSSNGLPAIDINITGSSHTGGIRKQKIHFILEE